MSTDNKTKTAEFARLFNLFEQLASRGKISSAKGDTLPIPKDIAPVFRNLAALLDNRSSLSGPSLKFPLEGTKYPFTFKLMIHKLYNMQEWAEKVKKVVEASRMQYKPLAETKETANDAVDRPHVPRIRCHTIVSKAPNPTSPTWRSHQEDERVVKKRCVGRRKSISGAMEQSTGSVLGVWVYDAAVSSVEREAPRQAAMSSKQTKRFSYPLRSRHQSLAQLDTDARETACQRVESNAAGGSSTDKPIVWQWTITPSDVEKQRVVPLKRRALSVAAFRDHGPEANKTKKRPFWT